jgi:predicted RNase H-like HicB family nuclease
MAERIAIHIECLPEGVYLATSPDVPGLTVEGNTREETQRIAREVALDLLEVERGKPAEPASFLFTFD